MKTKLYLIIFFTSSMCLGQVPGNSFKKLSPDQLQQDFGLFRSVLLNTHPHLNRLYNSQAFTTQLDRYEFLLNDPLTSLEFFQVVSSAMSDVGEAHSHVNLSDEIKSQIKANGKLFPFDIHFYEKRAFILNDLTDETRKLSRHELISVNGKNIDEIISLSDSISCMGSAFNRSRVYRKLSYSRNFALAYYLYVDQSSSYLIEYREPGSDEIKATVVNGISPDFEAAITLSPIETTPPYSLTLDESRNVAIIKIKTFAHFIINYSIKEYLRFYQKSFEQIAESGISNLVIDVRGNRGGQEKLGAHLLSYLIDYPFKVHEYVFTKNIDHKLLDSLNIFHHSFSSKKFQVVDSGYVASNGKNDILYYIDPTKKNAFKGDVYILTDGNCFSACNIFMALADHHKVGTIVGEESGGSYQDSEGYPGVIFKLPNSGLGIDFRLWHLRTAVDNPGNGRGVLPNVPIQPTVNDIVMGKDAALEKVYELIRQAKSQ